MQELLIFQSIWAMELRRGDGYERSLEENVEMIAGGGFQGVSVDWRDPRLLDRLYPLLQRYGLSAEGVCYPRSIDDLKKVLDNARRFPVQHINAQPDLRPRRIQDCIPFIEGWRRLANDSGIPVLIETHRDRMTTDLYFTLDLLDCFPDLKLLADLSHFVVGREFSWPVPEEAHRQIERVLDQSWAFHGRVASREQVQIELSFMQHQPWFEQFLAWWSYGFKSWRQRAKPDDKIVFTCELGPKPYAITGRDGEDSTDRWQEALMLKERVRQLWSELN